jgi:hypothetical protein
MQTKTFIRTIIVQEVSARLPVFFRRCTDRVKNVDILSLSILGSDLYACSADGQVKVIYLVHIINRVLTCCRGTPIPLIVLPHGMRIPESYFLLSLHAITMLENMSLSQAVMMVPSMYSHYTSRCESLTRLYNQVWKIHPAGTDTSNDDLHEILDEEGRNAYTGMLCSFVCCIVH